jgi:hypothetical protein
MASFANSKIKTGKEKARRYLVKEWELWKLNIERLYVTEDRSLEVIQVLKQEFGFIAR